jgi:hypothetical protein
MHARFLARSFSAAALLHGLAAQSPPVQVSNGVASMTTAVGTVAGDAVYFWWSEPSGTFLQRSRDRGQTWLGAQLFPQPAPYSFPNALVANANDVFAFTVDWNASTSAYDIHVTRSPDFAASWLPAVTIATGLGSYVDLLWTQATDTGVFAYWISRGSSPQNHLSSSLDRSATWQTHPAPGWPPINPALAADGIALHAAWHDTVGISGNRSLDGGATWLAADVNLSPTLPAGVAFGTPKLVAANGSVFVAWIDGRGAVPSVFANRSVDAGSTWLANEYSIGGPVGAGSTMTDLALAADGTTLCAAWAESTALSTEIWARRLPNWGALPVPAPSRIHAPYPVAFRMALTFSGLRAAHGVMVASYTTTGHDFIGNRYSRDGCAVSADQGASWHAGRDPVPADTLFHVLAVGDAGVSTMFVAAGAVYSAPQPFGIPWASTLCGAWPYGAATAGTGAIAPTLDTAVLPVGGGRLRLRIEHGLAQAPALLALGIGPASAIAQPLLGGTLLVQPAAALFLPLDGNGTAEWSVPLPAALFLGSIAWPANAQAFVLDANASGGVAMSRGLAVWPY